MKWKSGHAEKPFAALSHFSKNLSLQITCDLQRVFQHDQSVIWQVFWFAKILMMVALLLLLYENKKQSILPYKNYYTFRGKIAAVTINCCYLIIYSVFIVHSTYLGYITLFLASIQFGSSSILTLSSLSLRLAELK